MNNQRKPAQSAGDILRHFIYSVTPAYQDKWVQGRWQKILNQQFYNQNSLSSPTDDGYKPV
jgi:hypothetical protein